MKSYFLLALLFFLSQNIICQTSYDEEFETSIEDCFFSYDDKGFANLKTHLNNCMKGKPFAFFCVRDIKNEEYCSSDFDSYHLINYWFEACPPCKTEKKYLLELSTKHSDLTIISLSTDDKEVFKKYGYDQLSWICVADYKDKEINNNRYGYPITILLNRKGEVELFFLGGIVSDKEYSLISSFLDMQ